MSETVRILGAPMDYGADRRGVDMGPSAIRYAGLADRLEDAGVTTIDDGDLSIPRAEERDPDAEQPADGHAKFLREVEDVCTRLGERVESALENGEFPLVLGGDHSVAIGSMRGSARDADLGAIWFDAHADLNTPATSPSGNVHGMPLAATLGRGAFGDVDWAHAPRVREESIVYVGLRSIDDRERELVRESEMTAFTMADIDEYGMTAVVEDALDVATSGTDGVHVSLDLDWLDPKTAPGVGTPVRGGVTYREAHAALETVATRHGREGVVRSMDVVEVNPILDERNETARLAAELTASAFGNRIL
ncbi:arginase [Natronorubrum daqingense]|uniref:Arginase n=1 Tax=Natronorubrum daqingense TaxID=588898 RepID=A0A1N7E3H9_9EURY|nr:arginase [Natronorubrum daqingense]APX96341.1 arginase [Natronorubrum daqingense]SIR82659.1 arginase [Natronorubrum daqingense]